MTIRTAPGAAEAEIAGQLADHVLSASFADLPQAVQTESVRAVVNWAGCALGGAPTPTVDAAVRLFWVTSGPKHRPGIESASPH